MNSRDRMILVNSYDTMPLVSMLVTNKCAVHIGAFDSMRNVLSGNLEAMKKYCHLLNIGYEVLRITHTSIEQGRRTETEIEYFWKPPIMDNWIILVDQG